MIVIAIFCFLHLGERRFFDRGDEKQRRWTLYRGAILDVEQVFGGTCGALLCGVSVVFEVLQGCWPKEADR
jgi:hypothetical protein